MVRSKTSILSGILFFAAIIALIFQNMPGLAFADQKRVKVTTKIKHRSIKYFVPEHRIKITAKVEDKNGVNLVRCYFKATGQANFVFVSMNKTSGTNYEGILPSPSQNTNSIEYLLLAVNGKNAIIKSQTFTVNKKDDKREVPVWQEVSSEGDIKVSTELTKTTEAPKGFSDNIKMDIVESSSRFGSNSGIYPFLLAGAGGATGVAAAADIQGIGTVNVSAGFITTKTAVIGGLGIAGAIGAGAAASSNSSSSDGGGVGGIAGVLGAIAIVNRLRDCPVTRTGGFSEDAQVLGPFDLGQPTGTFNFHFDTGVCPDSFTIKQRGNTIEETGCVIRENGFDLPVTLEGTSRTVTVEVEVGCVLLPDFPVRQPESTWSFTVNCPN